MLLVAGRLPFDHAVVLTVGQQFPFFLLVFLRSPSGDDKKGFA